MISTPTPCPCGSGAAYGACCGRYIDSAELAPDAERLMRSRYTAYTLLCEDYLLATWHPSTRPASLGLGRDGKWLGLSVKRHEADAQDPDRATVEFVARLRPAGGGAAQRLHEVSRFVREGGRWYYVDGDTN